MSDQAGEIGRVCWGSGFDKVLLTDVATSPPEENMTRKTIFWPRSQNSRPNNSVLSQNSQSAHTGNLAAKTLKEMLEGETNMNLPNFFCWVGGVLGALGSNNVSICASLGTHAYLSVQQKVCWHTSPMRTIKMLHTSMLTCIIHVCSRSYISHVGMLEHSILIAPMGQHTRGFQEQNYYVNVFHKVYMISTSKQNVS